jgi:hypothetical protein
MGFFKKLFGKSETVTPAPNQNEPALEPIVLQAIENLYPDTADQSKAIEYSIRYKKYQKADTLKLLLSLLAYSDGKIEKLLATEPDAIRSYQFMLDEIDPRFPDLKAAEEWVKSITKPQV